MLQNLKIMTTLTTPQRVIIFGGSNAKRIVPFLLKFTKGKGIRVEDRTVSGHRISFLFFQGEMMFSKKILKSTDVLERFREYVLQNVSLILCLQYKSYMKISRKS